MAGAFTLRAIDAWNRLRLAWLRRRHPGLEIDRRAGSNLAVARFSLAPGARVVIGPGVVTERMPGRLHFIVEAGARIEIGADTWLRTEVGDVHLVAFAGARLVIGPDGLLNGCHLSAKLELVLGRRVWVGPGTRVFDSDQHDLDADRPERSEPVRIDDHVWISADCAVMRGVHIGEHCVVGARSVVTGDLPSHTLAFGSPARERGKVGDRSRAR